MKLLNYSFIKVLLLFAILLFIILPTFGQNPLDISSRLSSPQEKINSNSFQSQNSELEVHNELFNPLDVKKEPNRQKSKPLPSKEIKQNVNGNIEGLSKPFKIVILLSNIVFFVLIRNINLKGFQQIGQSFLSNIKLVEFKNSFSGLVNTQIALFYIFFFANMAYFFYICSEKSGFQLPSLWGGPFITILILIMGVYIVKYVSLKVIEFALSIRRAIENHLFSVSIHNILLGLALFFINTFFAFSTGGLSSILMYLGLSIIVLFYLIRQAKGLQYLSEMRLFSFFHFFIYLCTCEISPLLIAAKMIIG